MNDVTIMVKQNVTIMTILNVKQVLKEWVPCKTFNKVLLSLFKSKVKIPLEKVS